MTEESSKPVRMIWWCLEHEASGWGGGKAQFCHLHPFDDEKDSGNYPCRMVERRLVDPDKAIVIEKGEDGEWPVPRAVIAKFRDWGLADAGRFFTALNQ